MKVNWPVLPVSVLRRSPKMKLKRHHVYAVLLALLCVSSAVSLLFVNQWFSDQAERTVMVREVKLVALAPPPPPPPTTQQPTPPEALTLAVEGQGPAVEISLVAPVALKMDTHVPTPQMNVEPDWQSQLDIDWQAFGLNDLDGLPQLLTPIKAAFPNSLVRKGVHQAVVKLDVFIDEQGQISLISIAHNPYPELNNAIDKIIKSSRFSTPKKNGEAVKARFIWPVEFKKS